MLLALTAVRGWDLKYCLWCPVTTPAAGHGDLPAPQLQSRCPRPALAVFPDLLANPSPYQGGSSGRGSAPGECVHVESWGSIAGPPARKSHGIARPAVISNLGNGRARRIMLRHNVMRRNAIQRDPRGDVVMSVDYGGVIGSSQRVEERGMMWKRMEV